VQHPERPAQPYTAEFKITTVQTLADGTTITIEETEIRARDWQGRMMESTTRVTPNEAARAGWTDVHVNDPVESTQSNWNSFTMKGSVIKYPAPDQRHGCWASDAGGMRATYPDPVTQAAPPQKTPPPHPGAAARPARQKATTEDLGTQNILGVEAQGRRETRTIPVGQVGNDRPIATVNETWWAPNQDLPFSLREIVDDPRSGKRTREIVRLDLTDPDPDLFQPPANYEIKREELHQVPCDR
jgi:hypothetical protein